MSATALKARPAPKSNAPYTRSVEVSYMRLIIWSGEPYAGSLEDAARKNWRIAHCNLPEGGRAKDIHERVLAVESTRVWGRRWLVNLKTMTCCDQATGEACPDKVYNRKAHCCHAQAALIKEKQLLSHNRGNALMFPARKSDCSLRLITGTRNVINRRGSPARRAERQHSSSYSNFAGDGDAPAIRRG